MENPAQAINFFPWPIITILIFKYTIKGEKKKISTK